MQFSTSDGDWTEQRKAKELNKFLDGLFYQTNLYTLAPEIVRDAALFGNGYLKIFQQEGKVKAERVHPVEILVDLNESMHGSTKQLFQVTAITRDKIRVLFPNKEREINLADPLKTGAAQTASGFTDDLVEIYECWRLPSTENSKDGVHIICLQNCTLLNEVYDKSFFPIITYRYKKKSIGFYGESIANELVKNQIMLNKLLKIVETSLLTFAAPMVWVKKGGGFNAKHWTRKPGAVIECMDKPELLTQDIISQQIFAHIQDVYQKSFEQVGISQQTASAVKPAGVTAAAAMETLNDIQADRLSIPSIAYEQFFEEVGKCMIDTMKDIAEENKHGYEVNIFKGSNLSKMNWKDIELDDESYVLKASAVASLPKEVTGKLQYMSDLQALGIIQPYQVPRLIANPDLEAVLDPLIATTDRIYQKIDMILDKGFLGYEAPDQLEDNQQALPLFTNRIIIRHYTTTHLKTD